jgi:hypothetical protein
VSQQFNRIPNFTVPLSNAGVTSKDWFFFFTGLFRGLAPENVSDVTLGPTPYIYTAPVKGFVIIQGGTVSQVEFSRDGVTLYDTGQTAGIFPLNAADQLTITYSAPPTVTFVPS